MEKILQKLAKLIETNKKYIIEGALNRNQLAADARKYDADLLNILQKEKELKEHFFAETDGGLVFKKDVFLQFVMNKEFLPDSYTKYKIKIGLGAEDGSLLSENGDVVLNWPYKDAILEGGQDKEDQKRSEVFFNEVLAPDQITRLLDDKVFTNWKRYDKDGEHDLDELKDDDNLIIKGNNLVVLHSLKKRYAGKVKLIYIDPPYNTGNDSFGYNDRFNHSSWLTFMKNRLEMSRELLANGGSMWVTLDDNEYAYLRVLMDEVFGRDNFKATFVWHHRKSSQNDIDVSLSHNYTVCFSKNKSSFKLYQLPITGDGWENPDNDPRGPWVADPLDAPNIRPNLTYPITNPNTGEQHLPPSGRHWRFSREKFASALETNRIVWGKTGKSKPQLKRFLSEAQEKGRTPFTIWSDVETATNATKELMKMHGRKNVFSTPKPESLMERILLLGSKEGDVVLDYHLGSGTTAAVAHKMGRRYIGIEQLYYGENDATVRLQNVINGDQSGISKSVDWQGGGSFVYANIMNNANKFRQRVEKAKSDKDYMELLKEATSSSFLSYRVDPKKLNEEEFQKLSSANKRRLLLELIDNNTLYVNYEDINDPSFKVSEKDKEFNKKLYEKS